MDAESWPLFAIEIRTPRLTLRLPTDDDLPGLARAATSQIHDDGPFPFLIPWTLAPADQIGPGTMQFIWRCRGEFTADNFTLPFVAFRDGEAIGIQSIEANDFARLQRLRTGSWLVRDHQGLGLGKEMRSAVVQFGFDQLDAAMITSSARVTNTASLAVSRAVGYVDNGVVPTLWGDGSVGEEQQLRLDRARWSTVRRTAPWAQGIRVEGFDRCRSMFTPQVTPSADSG